MIKRITEALGSAVSFESQESKGTTFIIRLPHACSCGCTVTNRLVAIETVIQWVIRQMRFLHNNKGGLGSFLWSAIVVVVLIIVLVVLAKFLFNLF
jgi:heme/copper-type cytochrome/quinol oxidase subunit 4